MKVRSVIVCLLLISSSAFAQISNDSLEYRLRPDSARAGSLYLSVSNFNFLRNYEFYNKFQDGYTLFGSQLEPQLVYYSGPDLAIMGGVHLRKDFGSAGVRKAIPLFSLKYRKNNFTMIAGALEGNIHHRFAEPLFDVEKQFSDPVEYGTQFLITKRTLFLDAFINWRRMIYKPSPVQEQLLAGASSEILLAGNEHARFSIPLQLTVFHQGGQIDVTGRPLQTLLNSGAGFKVVSHTGGLIREWNTQNYLLTYNELSPTKIRPFSEGKGLYLNAGIGTAAGDLSASYWNGCQFISVMGMPVFQSLSQQINYPGYTEKRRELVFLHYAYKKKLTPNLLLDFRVEPVFDLGNGGKMDFYHSFFLVYRQQFALLKDRNSK